MCVKSQNALKPDYLGDNPENQGNTRGNIWHHKCAPKKFTSCSVETGVSVRFGAIWL